MKKPALANGEIEVKNVNPLGVRPEYVNTINIHSNPFEFVLEFGYVDLPELVHNLEVKHKKEVNAELRSKIVVSASHIHGFVDAINKQYQEHLTKTLPEKN